MTRASGMLGTYCLPPQVSDPGMHHDRSVRNAGNILPATTGYWSWHASWQERQECWEHIACHQRLVILACIMTGASGMLGTYCLPPQVSDPGMHSSIRWNTIIFYACTMEVWHFSSYLTMKNYVNDDIRPHPTQFSWPSSFVETFDTFKSAIEPRLTRLTHTKRHEW